MSSANVRSVQALEELRSALKTYASDARGALNGAEFEIRRTAEFLARREQHWQAEVRAAEAEVRRAIQAFNSCRAQVYRDENGNVYQPPCTSELAAVERAQGVLARAQAELANVRAWTQRVEQATEEYRRYARRLDGVVTTEIPKAAGQLDRRISALHAYLATHSPSGGAGGAVAGAAGAALGGALGALAGALVGGGASGSSGSSSGAGIAGGGAGARPARRIEDVPVAAVDQSDSHVHGPGDFEKVSRDVMVSGFERLQNVVRPAVARGAGSDDFARMDAERGLAYPDGYQRVFDAFYGGDRIRLERHAGQYTVINGFHRLAVARDLGIDSVPAEVIDIGP